MSRKAQNQTQVEPITTTTTSQQEEIMQEQQQEQITEITIPEGHAAMVTTSGKTVIYPITALQTVLSMTETFYTQYKRKAKERFYTDNVTPKPEGQVKYDTNMFERARVIRAFINDILDSIEPRKNVDELVRIFHGKEEEEEVK